MPHLKEQWVIPPEKNAAFLAAMEAVLDVYIRPRDPLHPLVCQGRSESAATCRSKSAAWAQAIESPLYRRFYCFSRFISGGQRPVMVLSGPGATFAWSKRA